MEPNDKWKCSLWKWGVENWWQKETRKEDDSDSGSGSTLTLARWLWFWLCSDSGRVTLLLISMCCQKLATIVMKTSESCLETMKKFPRPCFHCKYFRWRRIHRLPLTNVDLWWAQIKASYKDQRCETNDYLYHEFRQQNNERRIRRLSPTSVRTDVQYQHTLSIRAVANERRGMRSLIILLVLGVHVCTPSVLGACPMWTEILRWVPWRLNRWSLLWWATSFLWCLVEKMGGEKEFAPSVLAVGQRNQGF